MSAAKDLSKQYQQIIHEAQRLRLQREQSDAEFLLYLGSVERDHSDLLRSVGHPTFAAFLKATGLCDPARFANFSVGLKKIGTEQAVAIGADATIELANGRAANAQERFVPAVLAWREQHGGVAPSRETAAKILRQVDPRQEQPKSLRVLTESDRMRTEIARLTKALADARAALAKTEKERDALKARVVQLSKANSPKRGR